MNIANINTVLLVYIGLMVFAIGVVVMIYTGRIEIKDSKSSKKK